MKKIFTLCSLFVASISFAQTNVYDDVIATSPAHTTLKAALDQEGLDVVLQNPAGTFTVFAPTNDAFDDLASELGVPVSVLLLLPNLTDILTYHVLGVTVDAMAINNGDIVNAVSTTNTIKLTKTSMGEVYANQAEVTTPDLTTDNGIVHVVDEVLLPFETVVDVAIDNGFTTLTTAVVTAELLPALTDPLAELTVFAPDNAAFDAAVTALGIDIPTLLTLPNLADILTYHVLDAEVDAASVTNGLVATPISTTNTLKLTKTSTGDVFVNQAQVTMADVFADNGVVHVINGVVLPSETVVDVALDNGFSTLATAVITAELLPALTNPFATLTVFAPDNAAFDAAVTALGIDIPALLALPNLGDILTYHVLGAEVDAASVTNGQIATPLSTTNTLKLTKTAAGDVFVNQAQVTLADVTAENGIVHVINEVVLPNETVVDVALDNGFSTLATAVITAELLPALTDPFSEFTVFAPTNEAFEALATGLSTDVNGLLALENLSTILLHHVVSGTVLSTDLSTGNVTPLSGIDFAVDLSNGVMINESNVTLADVTADNGVVHVIDRVLMPWVLGTEEVETLSLYVYPNPTADFVRIEGVSGRGSITLFDVNGRMVINQNGVLLSEAVDLSALKAGTYFLQVEGELSAPQMSLINKQ